MRPELQAYLDGDLPREALPEDLRQQASRWETLLTEIESIGPLGAPAGLENRIVRSLPEGRRAGRWSRAANWALRPRVIRISPLAGLAAAAALALLIVRPWSGGEPLTPPPERTIFVQFMLEAPGASSVAVAGDFNGWSPALVLTDPDGDGTWTGRLPLEPGVHEYMFVIDGSQWITDPEAERYTDDGFGNRNAVLVVAPPTSQS